MPKNLNKFEQASRIVVGCILLFLSVTVFSHPVAKLLVILAGLWVVLEGVLGRCPFYHDLGVKKPGAMKPQTALMLTVAGIEAAIGYIWWHAGWIKIWNEDFVGSLPAVLSRSASVNHFWFMKNFMLNQGMKYYGLYGGLVELFQYVIGIGLIVLAYVWLSARHRETRRATLYLSVVGLSIGAFMNMIFYFAIGPTDTWIAAGNAVMFWVQLVMIYGFVNLIMSKEE